MCTVGDMVRVLQSYNSDLSVDELFQNSTFAGQIREVFNSWPERSKTTARKILKQSGRLERRSLPSEEALRAIRRTKNIALPASLTKVYEKWQRDPSTFWNSQGFDIGSRNIYQVYKGMKQLETQRHSGTIIWRYFTLFFYDLMRLLGDGRKYLVETLQDKLVYAIAVSGLVNASKDTIQRDIKRWASAGSKYCNIARVLGNGALMLLPHDVTDNIWENRLPMKGVCFEETMAHLTGLGIREVSRSIGADALGWEIRKIIIQPFRELPPDSLCQAHVAEIESPLGRGIEIRQVESERIRPTRVYEHDSLHCSPTGSEVGAGIDQGVLNEKTSAPPSAEWNQSNFGIGVTEQSEDSGAMREGLAPAAVNPIFDVAIDSGFMMPTLESSVLSEGYTNGDSTRADLSQFSIW